MEFDYDLQLRLSYSTIDKSYFASTSTTTGMASHKASVSIDLQLYATPNAVFLLNR